jgi:hypothetical protein
VNKLKKIVHLAESVGCVFIATADDKAMPHIAAASRLDYADVEHVTVSEWFCPGTVANLRLNKSVSIVVWSRDTDTGFQLLGTVEKVHDAAILDGYAPAIEQTHPMPQIRKSLLIKVERILDFTLAPHSDTDSE